MGVFEALELRPGITAIIGGGGKTTLTHVLAREKQRSIISTTTKIAVPEDIPLFIGADESDIVFALERFSFICIAEQYTERKLCAPRIPIENLARLAEYVFVEADGSRGLPLKAHADHEPVIPKYATVVYVLGVDGIGKTIEEAAHRPHIYAKKLGASDTSHIVTPEDAALMIPDDMRLVINKVDDEASLYNARRIASLRSGLTVLTALADKKMPVKEIWRNKRICS